MAAQVLSDESIEENSNDTPIISFEPTESLPSCYPDVTSVRAEFYGDDDIGEVVGASASAPVSAPRPSEKRPGFFKRIRGSLIERGRARKSTDHQSGDVIKPKRLTG